MRKPLVTFALFVYNHEKYVRESLISAFRQTYSPLEIIINDDCSSDGSSEIIREMIQKYRGPHNVIFQRNSENIGFIESINKIMREHSKGRFVVMAAGDDIAEDNRTEALTHILRSVPVSVAGSDYSLIDSRGSSVSCSPSFRSHLNRRFTIKDYIVNPLYKLTAPGATLSFDASIFESFGPIPSGVEREDWIIPFRGALRDGLYIVSEPLVRRRIHGDNMHHMAKMAFADAKTWFSLRHGMIEDQIKNYEYFVEELTREKKALSFKDAAKLISIFSTKAESLRPEQEMLTSGPMKRLNILFDHFSEFRNPKIFAKLCLLAIFPYLYMKSLKNYWRLCNIN